MRGRVLVAAVALSHTLALAVLLTRMAVAAAATGSPELTGESVRAIWLHTAVMSVPALLMLAGVVGLWLRRSWGWQAALSADLGLLALVAIDWLAGGQRVDHPPVIALLMILALPLLVPRLRALLVSGSPARLPAAAPQGSSAS